MSNKGILYLVVTVALGMISGCAQRPSITKTPLAYQGYPFPTQTDIAPAYPASTVDENSQTAFEAYPFALDIARKWDPEARLYAIPATGLMEMNLGYPPTGLGWFFTFKGSDPNLEYYVMVNDGVLVGATEAQPIIVGERSITYFPLPPLEELIDSDDVVSIYMSAGGEQYLSQHPDATLNPHLEWVSSSNDFPTWSIFDITQGKSMAPLMYINALTGEIVE